MQQAAITRQMCNGHYKRFLKYGDPLAGGTRIGEPLRWLQERVGYSGEGCLIWPFSRASNGYAYVIGKLASRLMCELAHGQPPTKTSEAAHNCGQGHLGCIHPGHLRWAEHSDNERDKIAHGTHNRGENHVFHKLTEADVRYIRSRAGESSGGLARKFDVSRAAIHAIWDRRNWAHLPDDTCRA